MSQNNINQNNTNEINIYNYTSLNNEFHTVEWIIDTRPDYSLTNNIQFIRRSNELTNELTYLTDSIMNNITRSYMEDEFIPFDSKKFKRISIETEVCEIPVSEEERNCCICYETKEYEDISHINCGHKFCGICIIDHISINYLNPCCPLCREKITRITFQRHFYVEDFEDL